MLSVGLDHTVLNGRIEAPTRLGASVHATQAEMPDREKATRRSIWVDPPQRGLIEPH